MYKVFVNEKVIFFTKNEKNVKQLEDKLTLRFFSIQLVPLLLAILNNNNRVNVVVLVDDYENAFKLFQQYFINTF